MPGANFDELFRKLGANSSTMKPTTIATAPAAGGEDDGVVALFDVGARAHVLATFDGKLHEATIVARKVIGAKNPQRGKEGVDDDASGAAAKTHVVKYYVRYDGYDNRMDEWVMESRVRKDATTPPGGSSARAADEAPTTKATTAAAAKDVSVRDGGRIASTSTPHATTPASRAAVAEGRSDIHERAPASAKQTHETNTATTTTATTPRHATHASSGQKLPVKMKNVNWIEMGRFVIDCWYHSPFPEQYVDENRLFICEFCLKYHRRRKAYIAHKRSCELKHPPGDEIYRQPEVLERDSGAITRKQLSMFEIDGTTATTYCQNLCLVAKLFLDHKTLYYDVQAFYFYVLTEKHDDTYRIVGYFSKEKGDVDTNLACILTLPPYQRRGYGAFLIAFSYELSKREGRIGTPERPLSDLGFLSYKSYWSRVLLDALDGVTGEVSVAELSKKTYVRVDDIVTTLQNHSSVRFFKDQGYVNISEKLIKELEALRGSPRFDRELKIIPDRLRWIPHIDASGLIEVAEKRRRTRLFQKERESASGDIA